MIYEDKFPECEERGGLDQRAPATAAAGQPKEDDDERPRLPLGLSQRRGESFGPDEGRFPSVHLELK